MSKNFYEEGFPDDDPTDELPILKGVGVVADDDEDSTEAHQALEAEEDTGRLQQPDATQIPTLEDRDDTATELARDIADRDAKLAALRSELASFESRWRETSEALAAQTAALSAANTELEQYRAQCETERDAAEQLRNELRERDDKTVALTNELDAARTSAVALEDNVRVLEKRIVELEAEDAKTPGERVSRSETAVITKLREEVAALAHHIENRNAIWRQRAAEVREKTTRIRELELELEQRITAERVALSRAEVESNRARDYRERLVAATAALEITQQPPQIAAEPPDETTASAREASSRAAGDRLSAELERAVALQQSVSNDSQGLRRFEEAELAIRELEKDMDDTVAMAHKPEAKSTPPQLICLTGEVPEAHPLDAPNVVIGRGKHCAIRLMTHYVSREHARLVTTDNQSVLEDLGSRNGVFVNSVRVKRQALSDDDLITIGDTQFRYRAAGHAKA